MRAEVKVRKGGRGQLRSARREGEGGEGEARVVSFHERTSAHSRVELIQVDAEYPSLQDRRRLKSSKLARSEREKEKGKGREGKLNSPITSPLLQPTRRDLLSPTFLVLVVLIHYGFLSLRLSLLLLLLLPLLDLSPVELLEVESFGLFPEPSKGHQVRDGGSVEAKSKREHVSMYALESEKRKRKKKVKGRGRRGELTRR